MSEENLSDLLERSARRHNVGSPPLDHMLANSSRARKRRTGFMALAASVAVGSMITGATLLLGHDGTPEPSTALGSVLPTTYPTVVPAGDLATWTLAPNQDLNAETTAFTVLVTRGSCNSGVTGEVRGPAAVVADDMITIWFAASPNPDGGRCPGNDAVPVKIVLGEPIGSRALVDGQCTNTRLTTTAFCKPSSGVRWPGTSDVPGTIRGQVVFVGGPVSSSLQPPSGAVVEIVGEGATQRITADSDGKFAISVKPGTYVVTATTSEFRVNGEKGLCKADGRLPVTANWTIDVQVYCTIK